MIRKIVKLPHQSLREKSKTVKKIDKKIRELIKDMWETLEAQKDPEGVGLAAPQVGKNIRLFILKFEGEKRTIINPKVIARAKEKTKYKKGKRPLEGCLSLPHYYSPIDRPKWITIEYTNEKGERKKEKFTGFLAQIIQHEMDHLNGVLFVDHAIKQNLPILHDTKDGWEEVEL